MPMVKDDYFATFMMGTVTEQRNLYLLLMAADLGPNLCTIRSPKLLVSKADANRNAYTI